MKLKSFLLVLCLAVLTCACSDDDDTFKIDGVNIVGIWAVFSSDHSYIDCNSSEDNIDCLYEFKSGGTYTYLGINYDDDTCPRNFTDGYIDCEKSHFDDTEDYLWEYRDGTLFISGFATTVKKISNDELLITYSDCTYTLKRVKGFKAANPIDTNELIGKWAAYSIYNYPLYSNSSEEGIQHIYEFNSDGTYTHFSCSLNDICSGTLIDGYIDCEESHFKQNNSYSWNYTDRVLDLDGYKTRIIKNSDDEFTILYDWEIYKLKRVKGFKPTNPFHIEDIMGTWAAFYPETTYCPVNYSENNVELLYEFNSDGTFMLQRIKDNDICSRTFKDGYIDCESSHFDNTEVYTWEYDNYWGFVLYSTRLGIKELSDDEIIIGDITFKRVKAFKSYSYDGAFNFNNVTAGENYSFDAIITGVCGRGIVVSNNFGSAVIYDASIDWPDKYNIGTLIRVNATATNYYGSLEFHNPVITVTDSSVRFNCNWNSWNYDSFAQWAASARAVGSSATSGMIITQPIDFKATLKIKDGTYYYYILGSGDSDTPITMFFPSFGNAASDDGHTYHFKGYPCYYNASKNYISVVVVEVAGIGY
jgi:hypothetical protein